MLMAFLAALTAAAVVMLGLLALPLLSRPSDPTRVPWSGTVVVLGGSVPDTHAWSRFHARYYPMTLLFIAFEMEMMFMYPWAVVYLREGVTALVEMGMFLGLLSVGILYAWREGVFRWQ